MHTTESRRPIGVEYEQQIGELTNDILNQRAQIVRRHQFSEENDKVVLVSRTLPNQTYVQYIGINSDGDWVTEDSFYPETSPIPERLLIDFAIITDEFAQGIYDSGEAHISYLQLMLKSGYLPRESSDAIDSIDDVTDTLLAKYVGQNKLRLLSALHDNIMRHPIDS